MEEKKNNVLLYVILFLIALLIGIGASYYYFSSKDNNSSCVPEECNCEDKCNEKDEDYILELFSKSVVVNYYSGNIKQLEIIKDKKSNFELKTKEDLRKFNDEYIIPLIIQHIEFNSPSKSWAQNEGNIALAINYIENNNEAYFNTYHIYTKEIVEKAMDELFNKNFNLDNYALFNGKVYYIDNYYYFASTLGATEGYCLEYKNIKEEENTIEYIYDACNTNDTEFDHYNAGSNVHITYEKNNNVYTIKSIVEDIK